MTSVLKAAFITGGSSGIGYGLAQGLLDAGYGVTVIARQKEKLNDAVSQLGPGPVRGFSADMRSEEEIEAAVAFHHDEFGRLDVLINNAGVATAAPIESMSTKAIDLTLSVNLRSAMLCTRACIGMLLDAAPSNIINISSLSALETPAGMSVYSASKAGLVAFTDVTRKEYGARGVKATAICPAFVHTAMSGVVQDRIEPGELIPVSDIVDLVLVLLRLSPSSVIPTIAVESPAGGFLGWSEHMEELRRSK